MKNLIGFNAIAAVTFGSLALFIDHGVMQVVCLLTALGAAVILGMALNDTQEN